MKKSAFNFLLPLFLLAFAFSCGTGKNTSKDPGKTTARNINEIPADYEKIYTDVQRTTFQYFWDGAEPTSGLARERFHVDNEYPQNDKNVVTIGGGGFGVMAILVGIERGFITRQQGFERLQKIVSFLEKADRFYGVWPHWLYGETGKVK